MSRVSRLCVRSRGDTPRDGSHASSRQREQSRDDDRFTHKPDEGEGKRDRHKQSRRHGANDPSRSWHS
jgi:hypothetical protein